MQRRDSARTKLSPARAIAIVIAAAMGLAAVCLVVFATTQKQLQIGVLLGLWGGLIAAFLVFGARRSQAEQSERLAEAELRVSQLHEAQLQVSQLQREQLAAAQQALPSQELQLHRQGELELSREVAARREADLNLELSLRREIERMMTEHIGALREEVASLRAEVVDKLGGQLRLERIETTRLIGSDLEALQHEIRRLAGSQPDPVPPQVSVSGPLPHLSRDSAGFGADVPVNTPPWRVEQHSDIVDAEVIEAEHATAHDEVGPLLTPFEAPDQAPPAPEPEPRQPAAEAPRWRPPAGNPPADPSSWQSPLEQSSWQSPADPSSWQSPADPSSWQPPAPPSSWQSPLEQSSWHTPVEPASWLPPAAEQVPPPPAEPVPPPAAAPPVEPAAWSAPTVVNSDPLTGPARPREGVELPLPLYRQSEQVAAFTSSFDPFAGLPRLSPLPDDVDLIKDPEPEPEQPAIDLAEDLRLRAGRRRAPDGEDPDRYHGRRRAAGEEAELNGHSRTEPPPAPARPPAEPGSGRRRAPDDAPDDLLARIPKY